MTSCLNINSVEFQALQKQSGISTVVLKAYCNKFLNEFGRFPELSELPNADSEPHLKELMQLDKYNSTLTENILKATGAPTVQEANVVLNNIYTDKEIKLNEMNKETMVDITTRPSIYKYSPVREVNHRDVSNSALILNKAINKLQSLYGIPINSVSSLQIASSELAEAVPDATTTNAFVYNGEIYINSDIADIDAPVHEMMHLLLGSLRMRNPELYLQLISKMEELPGYEAEASKFMNRTRQDVNEEIFVREMSKFVTGLSSMISSFPTNIQYELLHSTGFVLDTILMGKNSVNGISSSDLYKYSLKDLSVLVDSTIDEDLSLSDGRVHRILSNVKSNLMKNQELKEYCE